MNRLNRGVLTLVVVGAVSWGHQSYSAIFNIADGDIGALKSAIMAANTNSADDVIYLATNGTYVLSTIDNYTNGASGLPVITSDNNHSVAIAGNRTTIVRDVNAPVFRIFAMGNRFATMASGSVELDSLIITNGVPAIDAQGIKLILNNCMISGNQDGIYAGQAFLTLNNCTLSNNSGNFGAIWVTANDDNSFSRADLYNCTLTGNTEATLGGIGAAVTCFHSPGSSTLATLTSCTLVGNGIYVRGGSFCVFGTPTDAEVNLANCILKDSPLTAEGCYPAVQLLSYGYNLSNQNGGGFLDRPTDRVNTDPGLDPLGLHDNGGLTQTIALTYGSPAIDKGNRFNLLSDQRGANRPYDNPSIPNASGGDGSDIGAYEAPQDAIQTGPGLVVTKTDDHDDGVCGGEDCTLREAVARANSVPGASSIIFARSLSGTITLTMGELVVTDSLTITGIPIGTISGNNASRVFRFTGGSSYLNELTIRDGRNQVLIGNPTNGGGIYNSATLHVYGCSLINNRVLGTNTLSPSSAGGGAGQGGGIYNSGTLFLDASALAQTNQASGGNGGPGNFGHGGVASGSGGAGRGGAVFNDSSGSLLITNCTFNGNAALGGNGGSGGPAGGNGGNGSGGAIYNLGAITITSATISSNSGASGTPGTGTVNGIAGVGVGGLAGASGTATVANTISAGNTGSSGGGSDVNGAFVSSGYNLIGNGDFSSGFNAAGDQVGTTAAPINPHLGPLQYNGGSTNTMALLSNSPAIDQGKSFGLTTDQRYRARTLDSAAPNASGGDGTDIGAYEVGGGLGPFAAASRKFHGSNTTPFDVPLPLTGSVGIECRRNTAGDSSGLNVGRDHEVVLTFASNVSGVSNVAVTDSSNNAILSTSTLTNNVLTIDLHSVPDARQLAIKLSGVSDGTDTVNIQVPMGILLGDTTGNGSVNASDVSQTKLQSGQASDASNFREDVSVNGVINSSDVSTVKLKSGTALPP